MSDEDHFASNSNKESGDYFQAKTNSTWNLVSQRCSVESKSSSDKIKEDRQVSAKALIVQCQPIIERVSSAPSLTLSTNVLPPIQVKGNCLH